MFERRNAPLLPFPQFLRRMGRFALASASLVIGSLAFGSAGYHWIGGLTWIDSLLNAAMILTGMGPVDPMRTAAAKLFATGYALFSGVAFLTIVAVLLAPVVHRFTHHFHLELEEEEDQRDRAGRGGS